MSPCRCLKKLSMSLKHRFHPWPHKISVAFRKNKTALTKKIMEGEAALAFLNISRTARSDSPTNLFSNCTQERLRNEYICKDNRRRYLRSFDSYEVYATLACARPSKHRFTTTRRSIEQNTFRGLDAQSLKRGRMQQGPFNSFL